MSDPTKKPTFADLWHNKKLARSVLQRMPAFVIDGSHIPVDEASAESLSGAAKAAAVDAPGAACNSADSTTFKIGDALPIGGARAGFPGQKSPDFSEKTLSNVTASIRRVHAQERSMVLNEDEFYDFMTSFHPLPPPSPGKRGPKADARKEAKRRFKRVWRKRVTLPAQNRKKAKFADKEYLAALWAVYTSADVLPRKRVRMAQYVLLQLRIPQPDERTLRNHFKILSENRPKLPQHGFPHMS